MPIVIPRNPKIKVVFRGLIITRVKDGPTSGGDNPAWVAALSPLIALCHRPKVRIYRIRLADNQTSDITGGFNPEQNCSIVVSKTTPSIQTFRAGFFDRMDEANSHRNDFRWFVNLNEVHGLSGSPGNEVQPIDGALSPFFRFNDAILHTSDRSDGKANIRRRNAAGGLEPTPEPFGKFALEITARIALTGTESATFGNDDVDPIITANANPSLDPFRYHISYDCSCLTNEDSSDFEEIYLAIMLKPATTRKLRMEADPPVGFETDVSGDEAPLEESELERGEDLAASPETYCTGGTFP